MNESDKELIFSESVKAGKRIYYFDVKQSKNGDKYVAITESKKINEGTFENPRFVYEKHKLFLYKEDYDKFVEALMKTIGVAKAANAATPQPEAPAAEAAEPAAAPVAEPSEPVAALAIETVAEEPKADDAPAAEPAPEKKSLLGKVLDIF